MKLSKYGEDWFILNESNLDEVEEIRKVHLIKMGFRSPTEEHIEKVLRKFPNTNRFIIEDNVRFYNSMLRNRKKYYIENTPGTGLISFFKKNNKVLLNMSRLSTLDREFVLANIQDVLRNCEVIKVDKELLNDLEQELGYWNGNVLVS